jgi:serine/threonine protein kinase
VTDFGFSCFNGTDEDLVQVTRTEPWEAPEWHYRYFKLRDAKKMDIYSFGLLCLWLFFRDETLVELDLPSITVDMVFSCKDTEIVTKVQALKRSDDSLLTCAQRLVEQNASFGDDIRSRLRQAFTLALAADPNKRPSNMDQFIDLFCDPEDLTYAPLINFLIATLIYCYYRDVDTRSALTVMTVPEWHSSLQVSGLKIPSEL